MITAQDAHNNLSDSRLQRVVDIYEAAINYAIAVSHESHVSPNIHELQSAIVDPEEHDRIMLEAAKIFESEPRSFSVQMHTGRLLYNLSHLTGGRCLYFTLSW